MTELKTTRRQLLKTAAATGILLATDFSFAGKKPAGIALEKLPYPKGALVPFISKRTISFHYGKHHRGYVDKLNKAIPGTEFAKMELEEIIKAAAGKPQHQKIFNLSAQVYNHTLYWKSMKRRGGGSPKGKLAERLNGDLGGITGFRQAFLQCRHPAGPRADAAYGHRCVGARLLPGLPEPPQGLRPGLPGPPAQLGFRSFGSGGLIQKTSSGSKIKNALVIESCWAAIQSAERTVRDMRTSSMSPLKKSPLPSSWAPMALVDAEVSAVVPWLKPAAVDPMNWPFT
jgi:hypothetical protein